MLLSSPSFKHEQPIPAKFTCQGDDINPALKISGVPEEAQSLVLIMDDPDAPMGTWDHWLMWNIDPEDSIQENSVPKGAVQGVNSWKKNSWGGPCPPEGTGVHRYFFKVYAIDRKLALDPSSDKKALLKAIEGHVLAQAELMGTYTKDK